ncbi:MAG: helix-turn-helix domain-containing protein [Methylocystis sp.]|uniref:helix-turn-helix domain-containing protein n=1 Tax=Methylocystis sp. TaxID=1911079 RepID=UPI003DA58417
MDKPPAFTGMPFSALVGVIRFYNEAPFLERVLHNVNTKTERCSKMQVVQCKIARVALGLGVRELAELAQVAPATVSRLEAGEELKPRTVAAIRAALEAAGIEFDERDGAVCVKLRKGLAE